MTKILETGLKSSLRTILLFYLNFRRSPDLQNKPQRQQQTACKMQRDCDKLRVADLCRLVVIVCDMAAKVDRKKHTPKNQQRPNWEHSQRHKQHSQSINAAAQPLQQLCTFFRTDSDNRRFFARSYIIRNLVKVRTK